MTDSNLIPEPTEAPAEAPQEAPAPVEAPVEEAQEVGSLEIPEKVEAEEWFSDTQRQEMAQELLANDGKFTEDTVKQLESRGIPREIAEEYGRGQMALYQQERSKVVNALGGEEKIQGALKWAQTHYTPEQIGEFNDAMKTATPAQQQMMLKGLMAEAGTVGGLKADIGTTGGEQFKTWDDFNSALDDPRYGKDPDYVRSVEQKLANSPHLRIQRK